MTRFVYGTRANVPDYLVNGGVTYRPGYPTRRLPVKFYSIAVQGGKIPMRVEGAVRPMGFYTTIFISSDSPQRACQAAVARVRETLDSQESHVSRPAPWTASDLRLSIDEISEISPEEMDTDSGFAWYFEDEAG
ncbi:MAG: hypothetical protein AAGF23_22950 [Acidobacteriota bacterium]